MDYLPDKEVLVFWLTHYGMFAIFGLLALGIIALPVPEETLLVLAGILIEQGHLSLSSTLMAAYAGSLTGITVSYLLGRTLGIYFVKKYGRWIGLTEKRLDQVHNWFEQFGKWSLFFGYFIPGVRHFTGFCAGTSFLEYRYFAFFAYMGGIFWVSTFVSIGYFLGDYGFAIFEAFEVRTEELVLFILVLLLIFFAIKIWLRRNKAEL